MCLCLCLGAMKVACCKQGCYFCHESCSYCIFKDIWRKWESTYLKKHVKVVIGRAFGCKTNIFIAQDSIEKLRNTLQCFKIKQKWMYWYVYTCTWNSDLNSSIVFHALQITTCVHVCTDTHAHILWLYMWVHLTVTYNPLWYNEKNFISQKQLNWIIRIISITVIDK